MNAKRLKKDSLRPEYSAGVTVELPATTGHEAQGAICTDDGRMLSSRMQLTVSGPNG